MPRTSGGQKAHVTLQKAVACCRSYWTGQGRDWNWRTEVLAEDTDVRILDEPCERFVVDALGVTGFEYKLSDLVTAARRRKRVKGGTST
jgi:hypothetical protein